jgi:Probable Zinc-ribbon domain
MTAPKPRVVGLNAPELGRLPDATPYFAPLGEIPYDPDEDKVQCHLCGDWFRFVGSSHVRWHDWTLDEYREAFHLLKRTSTAAPGVSEKLRRNAIARKETNERWANPPRASGPRPGRGVPRWRSLAALRPDLAAELHPTRNRGLDPYELGLGSTRRVWWRCGSCGYEWRASIGHRVSTGAGCRQCTSAAWRVPRERSLAVLCPDLAAELHPIRNGGLDPYELGAGSHRRMWWRCGRCGHEWCTAVKARSIAGYGCPQCARKRRADAQRRVPPERSLAALHPDLARELHPTRNGDLDPYRVAPTSHRTAWWRCRTCGHEWRTLLNTRVRGMAARSAAGRRRSDADSASRASGRSRSNAPTWPPSCTRP